MHVLVSGSTGLVGSRLVSHLRSAGHDVVRLVRPSPGPSRFASERTVTWDPSARSVVAAELAGFDAVIHLAGENIAKGRWTDAKKRRIRDSRVTGTRLLSETLASVDPPPRVVVSASAIGYYGDRGDELLDETSAPGDDFLAEICQEWEAATAPLQEKGIRVVHPRIGVVLSRGGGALARMLLPFRLGLGGRIGSGHQYMSWISLDDLCSVLHRAVNDERLWGPLNAVSPSPVTNREFTRVLARVLSRPALIPVPAAGLRLALGEMADHLLLSSTRVDPAILAKARHEFQHPDLETALRAILGR